MQGNHTKEKMQKSKPKLPYNVVSTLRNKSKQWKRESNKRLENYE